MSDEPKPGSDEAMLRALREAMFRVLWNDPPPPCFRLDDDEGIVARLAERGLLALRPHIEARVERALERQRAVHGLIQCEFSEIEEALNEREELRAQLTEQQQLAADLKTRIAEWRERAAAALIRGGQETRGEGT